MFVVVDSRSKITARLIRACGERRGSAARGMGTPETPSHRSSGLCALSQSHGRLRIAAGTGRKAAKRAGSRSPQRHPPQGHRGDFMRSYRGAGGRRFALAFVFTRPFSCFFFWHTICFAPSDTSGRYEKCAGCSVYLITPHIEQLANTDNISTDGDDYQSYDSTPKHNSYN